MKKERIVLYVHGKGGNAAEAAHYEPLFPGVEVRGLDYQAETPWEAVEEFQGAVEGILTEYEQIILVANSIGAFFAMQSLAGRKIEKAYFISPMVDLEALIVNMMAWADISEAELQEKGVIETSFGETLSYEYLLWVRQHPIQWEVPTEILYGGKDNLQAQAIISSFAQNIGAGLTIMEDGEHWFHTDEQMEFLDNWLRKLAGYHCDS